LFRPLVPLFASDCLTLSREAAELIGDTQSWSELQQEMESFGGNCYLRGGFAVNRLGMRLSGRRVMKAVMNLFPETERLPVSQQSDVQNPAPSYTRDSDKWASEPLRRSG